LDIQVDNEGEELLRLNNLDNKQLPIVFQGDGSYLIKPSIKQIAEKIGLNSELKHQDVYDVVIIGAGPAGLAAAVYGASEGLKTLLIERRAPGGQAGTSSRIENYLGFPAGLSGEELTRRAITQAARLGTEFLSLTTVGAILSQDGYKKIMLEDAGEINARSVVITTGVDYRKLETKGVSKFNGAGIYYGAAMTEATASTGKDVYVVGGGNSAGQAAMYLSKFAKNVFIIIRKDNLSSTMSAYLIDQIEATDNIQIIPGTVVTVARGTDKLEQIEIFNEGTKKSETKMAGAMYIFIGAKPFTDWLDKTIIKDEKGFIVTGRDLKTHVGFEKIWKQKRDPYLLETSWPGVFAAGDVRSGAMNRVASAVGEGSMAISFVNKYLAEVK
jgi:thioredoxin reductase (NADPH)